MTTAADRQAIAKEHARIFARKSLEYMLTGRMTMDDEWEALVLRDLVSQYRERKGTTEG